MNEMMTWVSPKTSVQRFAANDSVSACLYAVCQLPTLGSDGNGAGVESGECIVPGHDHVSSYYEEPGWTERPHRECMCGAGASFNAENTYEFNNPNAYINELWVDKTDGTSSEHGIYEQQVILTGDNKTDLEKLFEGVSTLKAWWTTIFTGFVLPQTYTHTGIVSYDGRSVNHSG